MVEMKSPRVPNGHAKRDIA